MNREIGEIFHDGKRKVVCVQTMWASCSGCLYDKEDMRMCNKINIRGYCTSKQRSDNKNVIFKKVDN